MCRVLHSRLRRCLDGYTKASIGPTYKEQAQGQPVQRELRQPCNESPVLPVVGEREPVFCFGIAHSLDVFTKTTEEVVHLLWWKCDLALGFVTQRPSIPRASMSIPRSRPQRTTTIQPRSSRYCFTACLTSSSLREAHFRPGHRSRWNRPTARAMVNNLPASSYCSNERAVLGKSTAYLIHLLADHAQSLSQLVII